MASGGRKRLRDKPTYGTTFLCGQNPSASTSGGHRILSLRAKHREYHRIRLSRTLLATGNRSRGFLGMLQNPSTSARGFGLWTGLKAYWNFPRSVCMSNNCSAAQLTLDAEGNLPLPHTSELIPHTRVSLK
ncbi:hypothetical protein HID58_087128, partial [Brassica napus]